MSSTEKHDHKHPKAPPRPPTPEEEYKRLNTLRAKLGTEELFVGPVDPAAVEAALLRIEGWGAPDPVMSLETVPLPPPEVGTTDVTVYTYADTNFPGRSVRSADYVLARDPDKVIRDLHSVWVRR